MRDLTPILAAIKARNDYIESLPPEQKERALKLQAEIDAAMKKAGNQNNRLTIAYTMMMEKFYELNASLQALKEIPTDKPTLRIVK